MADPFSIAASSFAVVGAVDVVLRASNECRRFLSGIKDAPAEIATLQACVRENEGLLTELKKHFEELRSPVSTISPSAFDADPALDGLNSSIRALQRELLALQTLTRKHKGSDRTWGRVKWLLDERKVAKSLERLEKSKSTLGIALSLVEGRRSAFNQRRTEHVLQRDIQRVASVLNDQLQELSTIKSTEAKVLSSQEEIIFRSAQHLSKTESLQKELTTATQTHLIEHVRTRQEIVDVQRGAIKEICSELGNLRISLLKPPPVAPKSNRHIKFVGERRDTVLTPLLLMRDHVREAVLDVVSRRDKRLSPKQLYWLQSEFENLVASATQEAASCYQGSTATPFDHWDYSIGMRSLPGATVPSGSHIPRPDDDAERSLEDIGAARRTVQRTSRRSELEVFSSKSPIGELRLIVSRPSKAVSATQGVDEARITFIPSSGMCSTSVCARFVKLSNALFEPEMYTQLNAFRIVQHSQVHLDLIWNGSVSDIDAAFRAGTISPYDQTEFGHSICLHLAGLNARPDVLQYLDSQGVGASNLNAESDVIMATMVGVESYLDIAADNEYVYQKYLAVIRLLLNNKRTAVTANSERSLLHAYESRNLPIEHSVRFDDYERFMRMWMEFLAQNDYDLELRDAFGVTLLLTHAYFTGPKSLVMLRLLLEFGADIAAVTQNGENALQYAMMSIIHWGNDRESLEILEEKLNILIEAGADLHNRDKWGYTPSKSARYKECWDVWCRALERNGIKIEDVLREDGDLWLMNELVDESKERGEEIDEASDEWETEEEDEERGEEEAREKSGQDASEESDDLVCQSSRGVMES